MAIILNILKHPFIAPARLGRVDFINLCALLSLFQLILFPLAIAIPSFMHSEYKNFYKILLILNLTIVLFFSFVYFIRLNNARLHDFNHAGWWNICAIIPLVNLFFYLVLFLKPGINGKNKFGRQPSSPSLARKIAAIFSLIIVWIINSAIVYILVSSQLKS